MRRASDVVVVGAGQAGAEVAWTLRTLGHPGAVTLLGEEPHPPYERPPLSKDVLVHGVPGRPHPSTAPAPAGSARGEPPSAEPTRGAVDPGRLALRSRSAYADRDIDLVTGARVVELDHLRRRLRTDDGTEWTYRHCVLATGARARVPAGLAAAEPRVLRSWDDAVALAGAVRPGDRVLVVGGGFLGLEAASALGAVGCAVTVVERAPTLMPGRVSAHTAAAFLRLHRSHGVRIALDESVTRVVRHPASPPASGAPRCSPPAGGSARTPAAGEGPSAAPPAPVEAHTASGRVLHADHLVVAAGAVAGTELARQAGAECGAGVLVDAGCRTSLPDLYAVGDLSSTWGPDGAEVRVESVQRAVSSARAAAHALAGRPLPAARPATFWSQQQGVRLQTAGVVHGGAPVEDTVEVADPADGGADRSYVVHRHQRGRLVAVECVGRPADFVRAVARIGAADAAG